MLINETDVELSVQNWLLMSLFWNLLVQSVDAPKSLKLHL